MSAYPGGETVVYPVTPRGEREVVAKGAGGTGRSSVVGASRAAGKVRRYCLANGLDRLLTLTFAEEPETWDEAWAEVEHFRRALYRHFGRKVPVVVVPENGTQGGRKHFHLALGSYLPKERAAEMWANGFVDIRRLKPKRDPEAAPAGASERAVTVAGYLTAYVKKGFTEGHDFGRARYSITKGFVPTAQRSDHADLADALGHVTLTAGGAEPFRSWSSADTPGWAGPPVVMQWHEPRQVNNSEG